MSTEIHVKFICDWCNYYEQYPQDSLSRDSEAVNNVPPGWRFIQQWFTNNKFDPVALSYLETRRSLICPDCRDRLDCLRSNQQDKKEQEPNRRQFKLDKKEAAE